MNGDAKAADGDSRLDLAGPLLGAVHHVGLTVSDIERSIHFYRDVLGMTLVGRRPLVDADYVGQQTGYEGVQLSVASFQVSPGSRPSLEVVQYLNHTGQAADQATNRPGNSHLCFVVDDFDACYRRLQAHGVRFKSDPVTITAGPNQGGVVIYFFDPDGHPLELFQPPVR
jgi:catechol 2,3-dioxygenase-like lactoylglutathione lyase family enzyme